QNHNWISTAGLGLAALALSGEDARASTWLSLAQGNLQKLALALGPISDGTFHEGLPYQGYGVSMSMPFWTALAQSGADYTDLGPAVLHSSWDAGDLAVGFKAGVYGGNFNFARIQAGGAPGGWLAYGHDHNDDMSFWLFGRGAWLAPEAEGYTAGVNTS